MQHSMRVAVFALVAGGVVDCTDASRPTQPAAPLAARSAVVAGATTAAPGPSPMVGGGPAIGLAPVVRGLVHPVALVEAPDGTGRRFIVDQVGVIRVLLPGGTLLTTPFLDLRSRIVSLMPAYDLNRLNAADLGDLVAYLQTLRAGSPAKKGGSHDDF